MRETDTVFMAQEQERKIVATAIRNGFSVTPSHGKSSNRKEIELRHGIGAGSLSLYISRSVGICKGRIQVVLSPSHFAKANASLIAIENVEQAKNQQTKTPILSSSNYRYFQNKGTAGHREHWGYGYRLPANDGLLTLNKFMSLCGARQLFSPAGGGADNTRSYAECQSHLRNQVNVIVNGNVESPTNRGWLPRVSVGR